MRESCSVGKPSQRKQSWDSWGKWATLGDAERKGKGSGTVQGVEMGTWGGVLSDGADRGSRAQNPVGSTSYLSYGPSPYSLQG